MEVYFSVRDRTAQRYKELTDQASTKKHIYWHTLTVGLFYGKQLTTDTLIKAEAVN